MPSELLLVQKPNSQKLKLKKKVLFDFYTVLTWLLPMGIEKN